MKLKSKLIATIVSICAAIAVMGVGVWAATESFTVTVTNTVNISVSNLSGTVKATATAVETTTKTDGTFAADEYKDVTIFDSKDADKDDPTFAITESVWNGAGLFNNQIDSETTEAVLTYTFVFTPYGAGSGNITVAIDDVSVVTATGATITYNYTINGEGGALTDAGATKTIAASADPITVIVTATYSNANLVSAKATGSFDFAVSFTAAA